MLITFSTSRKLRPVRIACVEARGGFPRAFTGRADQTIDLGNEVDGEISIAHKQIPLVFLELKFLNEQIEAALISHTQLK